MTLHHHPSDALLLDYASGSLGEAWSLAIATHLAFCPVCRHAVSRWEAVGGSLLHVTAPAAVDSEMIDGVLARIDALEDETEMVVGRNADRHETPILPQPLRGYLGGDVDTLDWQRLGLGAYQLLIPMDEEGVTARLLKIPAGRPVPEHSHRGLEVTLVLSGAYGDATGTYTKGDIQEADDSLEHQPIAAPHEDCICLAVTDAPLRFRSLAVKMLQPILGI